MSLTFESRQLLKDAVSKASKARAIREMLAERGRSDADFDGKRSRVRVPSALREPKHGTVNEYSNYGCRCDLCKAAKTADMHRLYRKPCIDGCGRMAWHYKTNSGRCISCANRKRHKEVAHGTEKRYKLGCHCDLCRSASAIARRERRRSKAETDQLGTT